MGIRIKKEIGYFISKKEIKKILVKNYKEILEDLDYDDEKKKDFQQKLIENLSKIEGYDVLTKMMLKPYQKAINENTLEVYKYISNYSDKGILFKTIEHEKISRYDDLIDYYDNSMEDEIKVIYRPIYPMSMYVYNGGIDIEMEEKAELKIGKEIEYTEAKLVYLLSKNELSKKKSEDVIRREIVSSRIFTPKVHEEIFAICKATNILKENISKVVFNSLCQPVIMTSWC